MSDCAGKAKSYQYFVGMKTETGQNGCIEGIFFAEDAGKMLKVFLHGRRNSFL